jgi:hypothetical protein
LLRPLVLFPKEVSMLQLAQIPAEADGVRGDGFRPYCR